ncbi:MAG TPA: alpha/beta hydrolase [Calditrichia bacterium]|nr:alpha/beta hydrolase [Calditrichota bacterium]HQU71911.1 alpha/beta hydrolase [Calditrichia bacterium]HQV30989.1 alpha/beta hydrolase [Calditrichia bacterium]
MQNHRQFSEIDNIPFAFYEKGNAREILVLTHGGGSDSAPFCWQFVWEDLARHFRVYAPDLPGFGDSPWYPEHLAPGESLVAYHARFLKTFIEHLPTPRVNLVAFSMSGAAALSLTLKHPQLVKRLILVDAYGLGGPPPGGPAGFLSAKIPGVQQLVRGALIRQPRLVNWGFRRLFAQPERVSSELTCQAWEAISNLPEHPAWKRFMQEELSPVRMRSDFRGRLKEISCPTLLIHGEMDRLFSRESARRASETLSHGQLEVLDQCGHCPQFEKPGAMVDLILDFCGKVSRSG